MKPLYHIASYQALAVRKLYSRRLERIARREIPPAGDLARDVVYFSSRQDLPEQVASIRSLIRNAGKPRRILVVSDGTHSESDRALLRILSDVLEVVDYREFVRADLPDAVQKYARVHPFGKKLGLLMTLPLDGPVAYVDSDVLFFPGAASEASREVLSSPGVWYLPNPREEVSFLDERMIDAGESEQELVNGGFMLCDRPLRWDDAVRRVPSTTTEDDFFVEQTVIHIAVHQSEAKPLPTSLFELRLDDQFLYRDLTPRTAAMRHYTRTVRNKFWLAVARAA